MRKILVAVLAVVGSLLFMAPVFALGAFYEAEDGARAGNISNVTDAQASNGLAIKFDAPTPSPTPPPPTPPSPATMTMTVNGSDKKQTIDGFGVNINSLSWNNGESRPAIDALANAGSTIWRVVLDEMDWEATNDNADPNTFNWTYYNTVFSSAKFEEMWQTLAYINSKGITDDRLLLSFMGQGPGWMGGHTVSQTMEDEWIETVVAAAYYAKNTKGIQFGSFNPNNEPDQRDVVEGVAMDEFQMGRVYKKLARKLDAVGLGSLKIVTPETTGPDGGTLTYLPEQIDDSILSAKIDHVAIHAYVADITNAVARVKNSAPGKNLWVTEYGTMDAAWKLLTQGANALVRWEGFDSVYNHAIRNGLGSAPGNDSWDPGLLSYSTTTGVYTPIKEMYNLGQIYRWVPRGSQYVTGTSSNSNVTFRNFVHTGSGYVTIVGWNKGSGSQVIGGTLSGTSSVSTLRYYQTNNTSNMTRGADVVVSGNTFNAAVPGNTIFTLTNAP